MNGSEKITPLWARRPEPPEDPLEALKELVAEYTTATARGRNYGSSRFADLFYRYLTDLMPAIEQRRADHWAQMEAALSRVFCGEGAPAVRRQNLHAVKEEES